MYKRIAVITLVVLVAAVAPSKQCLASPYRIEGVGTLAGSPAFGVPGETVTVSIDLDPSQFAYIPVANPIFHYFETTETVPVEVVGDISGAFPNVDPVNRVVALELTNDSGSDQVGIDNGSGSGVTSIFTSYCKTNDCFDGDVEPFTPTELFELTERSVNETADWNITSFVNFFTGGSQDLFVLSNVSWTFTDLHSGPTQTVDIVADFDVKYTPGPIYSMEEGANGLAVGLGFNAENPEERAILEFPLDAIPANAIIESATLEFDPYVSSGAPQLEVFGYEGDGLASLSDGTAPGQVLDITDPASVSNGMLFDIETSYIQSLLGSASHLGVRLRSLDLPLYVGFGSLESSFSNPYPTLSLEYSFAGDFDGDSDVDDDDYALWESDFALNGDSDANGDGVTDGADFLIWQTDYLSGVSTPAVVQLVPEPSAIMLALGFVLFGWSTSARRNIRLG